MTAGIIEPVEEAEARLDHDGRMERLLAAAAILREGKQPEPLTVRELLKWFGTSRRGVRIVRRVRYALREAGLTTYPDFEATWIDGLIIFRLAKPLATPPPSVSVDGNGALGVGPVIPVDAEVVVAEAGDPTNRVKQLPAANQKPLSVKPDQQLKTAITLMLAHGYSQLPVMTTDREVKGVVSWRSIGSRWALGSDAEPVREYLEHAPDIAADRPLLDALPAIIDCGYVLVRDETKAVVGIVTASDLGDMFHQLAEPFLLLGEIERHMRGLIEGKFAREDLVTVKEAWDERTIETVSDLTFGQYARLLEDPKNWDKVAPHIDRAIFIEELHEVREIRNDVMHFNPDPLDEKQLAALRRFSRFLQTLRGLGL